uniref:Uncharacterized protein n=1 Tax=Lactuca sativa TaxID=4236 RepID=A0A9R1XLQ2_LACSA|nr:hypothetical protein LSAT_V11C400200560 [Lactuca sativa]
MGMSQKVSLLHMLEQGFLGKYLRQPVTNERMIQGGLIWGLTYKQMCTVFDKIDDHLNPNVPRGFVYAFKIWILETFPNSRIVGSPIQGVIPRAVVYHRMRHLHAYDC